MQVYNGNNINQGGSKMDSMNLSAMLILAVIIAVAILLANWLSRKFVA